MQAKTKKKFNKDAEPKLVIKEDAAKKVDNDKLIVDYDGENVPKALCTFDRLGESDDCISCKFECEFNEKDCSKCAIQKVFDKLAAYEKLKYTPDQLKVMVEFFEKIYKTGYLSVSTEAMIEDIPKYLGRIRWHVDKTAEYGEIGTAEEFKQYKKLDEDGLLLKLPCKVGDTVYVLDVDDKIIDESTILSIHYNNEWEFDSDEIYFCESDIGHTVFITREEAEKQLKELGQNEN